MFARRLAPALASSATLAVTAVAAQSPARVLQPRPLGAVVARASMTFGNVSRLFTLRGAVLLNDPVSRQVILLDSTLANPRVVLDSVDGRRDSYGTMATVTASSGLHRWRGDSAFWAPGSAVEAIIIGPEGKINRISATPQDGGPCLFQDMDNTGFLTCDRTSVSPRTPQEQARIGAVTRAGHDTVVLTLSDTSIIVAIEWTTWRVDTIGRFVRGLNGSVTTYRPGSSASGPYVRPVMARDVWTMFRDGTLAIARGVDYHVDIVGVNTPPIRGPRVPYAWRPVTDADYARITDSLRRMDSISNVEMQRRQDSLSRARGDPLFRFTFPRAVFADQSEWPTYWPPFSSQVFFRADEDDRLWLGEAQAPGADSVNVYAVFNRKGELIDRVSAPRGWSIIGFGPGGAVYLTTTDAGRTTLVQARFK